MPKDPMVQFKKWLDDAIAAKVIEPNAMCVATCGPDMKPSNRYVLLKSFDPQGFVFYTNLESRKSQQLIANPNAAATFWYGAFERSIRIEGTVAQVSKEESDAYFNSRCRGAQIGAWTSQQSKPVESGAEIQRVFDQITKEQEGKEAIERPPHWGGWRIKPSYIEFWNGKASRLHDRIVYTREGDGEWTMGRLQP